MENPFAKRLRKRTDPALASESPREFSKVKACTFGIRI
jgi:hypothetical protein